MWHSWLQKKLTNNDEEVEFFENECLYNQGAECTACVDLCRSGAFKIVDEKIAFDPDPCINCKLCSHCCPSDAIYIDSESVYHYEQKIIDRDIVCFTCPEHPNSDADIVVPCLSILSPEMVLIAFIHNKHVQIYFESSICKSCNLGWCMKNSIKYLRELNYITNGHVEIIHHEVEKVRRKKFSFRDFFLQLEDNWLNSTQFEMPESRNKRSYLIEYLNKEGKDHYLSLRLAKALRLTRLKVSENCILCGDCVDNCPVNALGIVFNDRKTMLVYQPIKCISCGICEKYCSNISLIPETKLSRELLEIVTLKNE